MKQQPYMQNFVETSQYFTDNSKLFLCQVQKKLRVCKNSK